MSPPHEDHEWRRKWAGIFVCAWLVFAIVTGGGAYYLTQRSQELVADAINSSACGLRSLAEPQLASYRQAATDKTLSPSAQARNAARIKATEAFLRTQRTVPRNFDCSTLKP